MANRNYDIKNGFGVAREVTPHNGTDLGVTDALYVAGAGTLSVVMANDVTVSFTVPAGVTLDLAVQIVRATGTTATGIVALYR